MGHEARGKHGLRVGDEVFGVVGVQRQGAHATYVISSIDTVSIKLGLISRKVEIKLLLYSNLLIIILLTDPPETEKHELFGSCCNPVCWSDHLGSNQGNGSIF